MGFISARMSKILWEEREARRMGRRREGRGGEARRMGRKEGGREGRRMGRRGEERRG